MWRPFRAKRDPVLRTMEAGFLVLLLAPFAGAQGMRPPSTTSGMGIEQNQMGLWMNESDDDRRRKMLENFSDFASKYDLKAPGAARREYEKGNQLLLKRSFSDAVVHFI